MKQINWAFFIFGIACNVFVIGAALEKDDCLTGHDIDAKIQEIYQQEGK